MLWSVAQTLVVSTRTNTEKQRIKFSYTECNGEKLGYGGWGDIHWECGSCHKDYFFKEGTPLQNDWHFCPKCGIMKVNEIRIGENLEDESK